MTLTYCVFARKRNFVITHICCHWTIIYVTSDHAFILSLGAVLLVAEEEALAGGSAAGGRGSAGGGSAGEGGR